MSWLSRLLGGKSDGGLKPQRLDYLNEALALERQGDFDAALTSYRLALRDHPNDPRILQNMAIAFSRTGRMNEAVGAYKVNTNTAVKNTIIVYKDMKVHTKFVNLKADTKGLAELNTAISGVAR